MRIIQNSAMIAENNIKLKEAGRPMHLQPLAQPLPAKPQAQPSTSSASSFCDIFSGKIAEAESLHFTKHANMRLNARNISLTNTQIKRVEDGINKAREKGIRDSLVLVDNVALLVNVPNKTVVTAMGKENDNIFTNIDGAVIV